MSVLSHPWAAKAAADTLACGVALSRPSGGPQVTEQGQMSRLLWWEALSHSFPPWQLRAPPALTATGEEARPWRSWLCSEQAIAKAPESRCDINSSPVSTRGHDEIDPAWQGLQLWEQRPGCLTRQDPTVRQAIFLTRDLSQLKIPVLIYSG